MTILMTKVMNNNLINFSVSKSTYKRLEKHAVGFNDTADRAINRLLDLVENSKENTTELKPELTFTEQIDGGYRGLDADEFKSKLVKVQKAEVVIHYADGSHKVKIWTANKFNRESKLLANIWSGPLRDWKKKGIVRAELEIYNDKFIKELGHSVTLVRRVSKLLNIPTRLLIQSNVKIEINHEPVPHLKIYFLEGTPKYASSLGLNEEDNCYYLTEKDLGLTL
ncbi:hypothetical protein GBO14_19130 [Pseudoalteromonas shioyasakiensis]|uniref:hypothetical protein n=1 Tax=Pseudoalteromonas shioyasakiensis TaxID=1190813 RepID=UPI002096495E|nr:hypothetical protein [Pseudoalteromonas shioyasakiensis]MCO6356829.1 hypothetical protein [Pseudoalteromonas shioyasakiensis]